jgi:hypothetical protein
MTNTHTFTGSVNITGSLIVNTTGTEFQVNNSGVVMGNLSTDNHAITGSLNMTGSLGINAASSFRFNGVGDNSHAVGYDTTVDGAFLRGQNGIRLITGGGSGIERMRISAAGTASFTGNSLTSAADAATINLKQNSTTANTGIYLERSGEQKGYYIYVGGSADSLTFQRNNAGTKADVMSLTRDGNVGIGVTNPQRQFVIADSSGNGLEISNSSGYSTLLAYNRTTSAYQNIVLGEGTGKVGIGITNPSYKLQVRPTTDVNMIVTNNGANLQIGSSNDAGNAATILNFTATSFTFNNDVTFSTNISLGANQRVKLSGGAGNLTGSGQTTISSTIATIFSGFLLGGVQTGNLVIVNGVKSGTGWNFTDLVNYMTNGTITVISSSTVNTPPARTYTVSGNDLRLSIAGGDTGFVSCTALTQGYQA